MFAGFHRPHRQSDRPTELDYRRIGIESIDTRIGFRSAADRAAFADDLTAAVLDLAARYHHDDGRPHRLVVAAHPLPEEIA